MSLFLVMAGGAIGSGARYLSGRAALVIAGPDFPYATLFVNLLGGLLMGVLAGLVARGTPAEGWRLFAGVGLLGGFTTFSAFSLDTVQLFERGAVAMAAGYVLVSVLGSIAALVAGLQLARAIG
ncbi:MAG TPA: fluoride efflux transporter CrcB [Sphingomonas sp.]|jgi:CrcB protein|uniref:fluoride efflux transporter CrcB n=1 Tax=Sphingomonas sp. TaxID=28214 RepID=UPI002EDB5761